MALAAYYWFSLPDSGPYLLFKTGWVVLGSILLVHGRFFWDSTAWLKRRLSSKENWFAIILFALIFAATAFGMSFYFWKQSRLQISSPTSESSAPSEAKLEFVRKPRLKLQGISIDATGTYAIVNGDVVQVGGVINGYRLEVIEKNRILISQGNVHYWLDREGHLEEA